MQADTAPETAIAAAYKKATTGSKFLIGDGDQIIMPEQARFILKSCWLPQQTPRMNKAEMFVLRHIENIKRGSWLENSQITFAMLPNGMLYLVNGYHRVSAVALGGVGASFNVQIRHCVDMAGVARLWSLFDRSTINRARTDAQALNSIEFANELKVQKKVAEGAYRAIPFIQNGMRAPTQMDVAKSAEMGILEIRCEIALSYRAEIKFYDQALQGCEVALKNKLLAGSVVAVALQTLRHCPDRAKEFWTMVAKNDLLAKKTPARTLVDALLRGGHTGQNEDLMIAVALAWNAFYSGRPLEALRVSSVKELRIEGTPVGARRQ